MNHQSRLSLLALTAVLTCSGGVLAQQGEAEPVAPASAPEAEAASIPAWFRLDVDSLGPQFWAGATHSLGPVDIASDIYVLGSNGEFDIGPVISVGDLTLTPMVGVNFDFAAQRVNPLVAPQLYTIYNGDPIYFESWIQVFLADGVFHNQGEANTFYTRNFLLFKLSEDVGIGPHVELTLALNDAAKAQDSDGNDVALTSMPVGGAINLAYGKGTSLLMFLGYETVETKQAEDKITGRFTWVHTF